MAAERRKMAYEYSKEEIEYIKRRLISYLEQGFGESNIYKRFKMSVSVYKQLFDKDPDISRVLTNNRTNNMKRFQTIIELHVPEE